MVTDSATALSPAKWSTASNARAANTRLSPSRSRTSTASKPGRRPTMRSIRSSTVRLLFARLSITWTSCPAAISSTTAWEPIYPAPPVTRTLNAQVMKAPRPRFYRIDCKAPGRSNATSASAGLLRTSAPRGDGSRDGNHVLGANVPSVRILEADDIVLAEVGARLHFNQLERHLAGILEPVARAEWNVGRLVFGKQERFLAARDLGSAYHDDPVLGAMVMHLQRQAGARIDDDAL